MLINVLEYLENSVKLFPGKIAFADETKSTSYSELSGLAKRIGSYIADQTASVRRKPIVVFVDRNLESLVSFMGVAYSGNFYVPIDLSMPKSRIELIIKTLEPVGAVVLNEQMRFVSGLLPDGSMFKYDDATGYDTHDEKLAGIRKSMIDTDPLYATFTSGSTGIPKGVITSHRSVIDLTEALVETLGFSGESIFGNQNPFYFDASIKDIYCTLKCSASLYIIPKSCFLLPAKLISFLNEFKINSILWSAAAIGIVANLNAFEPEKPDYLSKVMFSGEVMHNKILNYWRRALPRAMFVNLYGPTEITSVCTYFIIDRPFEDNEALPIGIPFRNTDVLLLNNSNQAVKEDEIGEICVRGCCLAMGYYNNPEKTAEAFCQNPLNSSYPEVIYRTGDLAKYNNEGQIMFLSRKDNQVKHMGHRVELGDIELFINSLELIDASICFYDHEKQKIILVYQGISSDAKYILREIKEKLPKFMFPNILIKLEQLPYNVNGKIDRTLLKKQYHEGEII